ncbi:hypothetical protein QOZ80_1BG0069800 [Eleusine coracana subsp. coracana]|nr:hypothetical protein QOZ80_1BG0069800 [Eleusine coracana subsp. coracana]
MKSRDVTFFENIFAMKDLHSMSRLSSDVIAETTPEPSAFSNHAEQTLEPIHKEIDSEAPRRSKRQRTAKYFSDDFTVYLVDDTPRTISEAYASPDADDWKEAVHSEMDSILSNGTWKVVDRPYGCKPVGCKWVFKKNLKPDGTIDKYKARLMAKGYTQKEGEDFFDTYSPVARLTTIRVLVALAASHGLIVHQMDVKTAFLNGELDEEICMDQPDGFVIKGQEDKVCKLLKSLYGLKQAPKQWHEKFDSTLLSAGFSVNEADKCVYYRHDGAVLEGYSDSNWISDTDELYATSGYVFTLGGAAVSWKSYKQTILTRSTMEAELTALDTATVEADWLRELLMDLPIVEKPVPAILMNCDNQTVIVKVNNSKDNVKSSRHIKRRLKSVRKMRNSGVISVEYTSTGENLADQFTKGLSRNVIDSASKEMGMRPICAIP